MNLHLDRGAFRVLIDTIHERTGYRELTGTGGKRRVYIEKRDEKDGFHQAVC